MVKNKKLNNAKIKKNDEFYTFYEPIELLLDNFTFEPYEIIWLFADSEESNFYKYFKNKWPNNYIVVSHPDHQVIISKGEFKKYYENISGDFFNPKLHELVEKLNFKVREKFDMTLCSNKPILITNPPFSMYSKILTYLDNYRFLLVAPLTVIKKDYIVKRMLKEEIVFHKCSDKYFNENNDLVSSPSCWISDLFRYESITDKPLPDIYYDPPYDKVLEVSRTSHIREDYRGEMGVPISFPLSVDYKNYQIYGIINPKIKGKRTFSRLLVRKL